MTNYSRTTLRELKKRYLNILKKCLLANLLAFSFVLPSMGNEVIENRVRNTGDTPINYSAVKFINSEDFGVSSHAAGGAIYNTGTINFNEHAIFGGYKTDQEGNYILDTEGNKISLGNKSYTDASKLLYAFGGAIFNTNNGTINFKTAEFIANTSVSKNNNAQGGAIDNRINARIYFNDHVLFQDNKTESGTGAAGGGLFNNTPAEIDSKTGEITKYSVTFTTATFLSNISIGHTRNSNGGGLYNYSGTIKFSGKGMFGGYDNEGTSLGNIALAEETEAHGGALYNYAGTIYMQDADFIANKAISKKRDSKGGAVYNGSDINTKLIFKDVVLFKDNLSQSARTGTGGAIYNYKSGFIDEKENIIYGLLFTETVNFENNTATGIQSGAQGGAIYNEEATMELQKSAIFKNNHTEAYAYTTSTGELTGGVASGGAIYNSNKGIIDFSDTNFENNMSISLSGKVHAGAIYNFSSQINFNGVTVFKNNQIYGEKNAQGGAIYNGYGSIMNFNKDAYFVGNKSNYYGGAIHQESQSTINFKNNFILSGNKAEFGIDIYNRRSGIINFAQNIDAYGNKLVGTLDGGIHNLSIIRKTGTGILVLGDEMKNAYENTEEEKASFIQTAGLTITGSHNLALAETHAINGGELKTHGAEIAYKAVVGQNVDDTGAVLSAGKVMHYTTKPEMEVNAETLANITFAGEDMGATIGVGTYNKAEQEKEIALVGDRLVEYVDDKGTEDTSDDELISYQATDRLFTIDTLAFGEQTRFKVTGALPNEKGNKIAFANGIVEIGDIQTLADYEFNSSTLKTPRDFEFKGKVTVNNLELSENLGNLQMKELKVVKDSDLDIKNTKITTDLFSLGGENDVKVSVHSLSDYGQILAKETVSKGAGTLTMNLVGAPEEGVYKVFEQDTDLKLATTHEFLDIADLENGSYKIKRKKTDELAEKFGLNEEETRAVSAVIGGNSENKAFQKVQEEIMETLKSGNKGKAKKALSAVGSKEHPVEQSVASEHLVALQNVVQAELHGTTVGRAGGEEDPRAKVYIKGLYDRTKSSMGEGFKARSKGAVLGVQSEVSEDLTLGVGYATSQTTAKEDLRRTEVDTNTGFISAHYQPNAWWVSGLATFSRGEYEEEKQILSSMGKASYDVDSWGAQVITGYDIRLKNAIITPEVGLRYLSVKQEGYTDTLGTTVSGTRSDYLTALVGVKGTWDMGAIRPTAGVTVGYDVISDDVSALNTLANGASYTVNGEALDRLSTTLTTGVEADLGDRTTLKLEYSGTYRKEYVDHSGMLRLEVKF